MGFIHDISILLLLLLLVVYVVHSIYQRRYPTKRLGCIPTWSPFSTRLSTWTYQYLWLSLRCAKLWVGQFSYCGRRCWICEYVMTGEKKQKKKMNSCDIHIYVWDTQSMCPFAVFWWFCLAFPTNLQKCIIRYVCLMALSKSTCKCYWVIYVLAFCRRYCSCLCKYIYRRQFRQCS